MRITMSNTSTFDTFDSPAAPSKSTTASKPGFFDRLIASRMRHGKARVSSYLARQSDGTLADLGFNAEQIAAIRKTGEIPVSFWR